MDAPAALPDFHVGGDRDTPVMDLPRLRYGKAFAVGKGKAVWVRTIRSQNVS